MGLLMQFLTGNLKCFLCQFFYTFLWSSGPSYFKACHKYRMTTPCDMLYKTWLHHDNVMMLSLTCFLLKLVKLSKW